MLASETAISHSVLASETTISHSMLASERTISHLMLVSETTISHSSDAVETIPFEDNGKRWPLMVSQLKELPQSLNVSQ